MTHKLPTSRERVWAIVRIGLGIAQMTGATTTVVLLIETGVSTVSLAATVATCALTTLSVLLFGAHHGRHNVSERAAPRGRS